VIGSWDGWTNKLPLHDVEGYNRGSMKLCAGEYEYSILVDRVAVYDKQKPNIRDNGNHYLRIKDFHHKKTEYKIWRKLDIF
jgi:hypothetical protein